jgi:hypothetical protein
MYMKRKTLPGAEAFLSCAYTGGSAAWSKPTQIGSDPGSGCGCTTNQLVGYGRFVVGLNGAGDRTSRHFTGARHYQYVTTQFGVTVPSGVRMQFERICRSVHAEFAICETGKRIDIDGVNRQRQSLRGGGLLWRRFVERTRICVGTGQPWSLVVLVRPAMMKPA